LSVGTRRSPWLLLFLLLALVAGLGVAAVAAFRAGAAPELSITNERAAIGRRTPVKIKAHAGGRGLGVIKVELVQGNRVDTLAERGHAPRPPWAFWGPRRTDDEIAVEVGRDVQPALTTGEATIRVTATRPRAWLRAPDPVVRELTLPVRLTPPSLSILSTQHYAAQGGSGAVVYRVGETSVKDGVKAGDWWSPGRPLPGGGAHDRFALYAVPYTLTNPREIRVVAEDDVGNRGEQSFVDRYFDHPLGHERLVVSADFMNKVVPEILSHTPGLRDEGDLLKNFLQINGELRRKNAEALRELASRSRPEFLWNDAFQPQPNAKVMSAFADHRTYLHDEREVDQQDHLGFDLASRRGAEIPASNAGVVMLADYFGIYGNTVVLDHGEGLMTLYAHLSAIDTTEGQTVERGQSIGRTGQTGLAGGDHLHFTVLLHGYPVTPVEWWDPKWIRDRIASKLGTALPAAATLGGGPGAETASSKPAHPRAPRPARAPRRGR
jgi:murein DD-endopeptidase MepM/ murein hydrolase activator NlpD